MGIIFPVRNTKTSGTVFFEWADTKSASENNDPWVGIAARIHKFGPLRVKCVSSKAEEEKTTTFVRSGLNRCLHFYVTRNLVFTILYRFTMFLNTVRGTAKTLGKYPFIG